MKRSNFCFIVGKLRFILCAVFILLCSCQKETNTLSDNESTTGLTGFIPSSKLGDWDTGLLINGQLVLYYKNMVEDQNETVVGYITSLDSLQECGIAFELDSSYNIISLVSGDESYHFDYNNDSVYITHLNSKSELKGVVGYKLSIFDNPATNGTITTGKSAGTAIVLGIVNNVATGIQFSIADNKHEWGIEIQKGFVDIGSIGVAVLKITVVPGVPLDVAPVMNKIQNGRVILRRYITYFENPYFGAAETRIVSLGKTTTVEITRPATLPDELFKSVDCVLAIKYCGIEQDLSPVSVEEADIKLKKRVNDRTNIVSFNIENPKFGFYVATSYLSCEGLYREGTTSTFFCTDLDPTPEYEIENYSFISMGTGLLRFSMTASMTPFYYDFPTQNIHLTTRNNTHLLYLGLDKQYKGNITVDVNNNDIDIIMYERKVEFPIKARYEILTNTYLGFMTFDLNPTTLTYSEQPSIRFESVKIDRTEKRTEKKNNVITRRGSSPDVPDEEEITYYTTYFTATYSMEGSFWIRDIYNVKYGTTHVTDLTNVKPQKTGTYKFQGAIEYNSDSPLSKDATIYCNMYLIDGSSIISSNTLYFYGEEEITTANCKDF